jgi:hypothetical protein
MSVYEEARRQVPADQSDAGRRHSPHGQAGLRTDQLDPTAPTPLDAVWLQRLVGNQALAGLTQASPTQARPGGGGGLAGRDEQAHPATLMAQPSAPGGSGAGSGGGSGAGSGGGSAAGGPAHAPAPAPDPSDYDRSMQPMPAVPPGLTLRDITAQLNGKVPGEISGFSVRGVTAGSHAEIFLLALLFGYAQRTLRGWEYDIVTAIDWPAKPGDPAPQGRVTVRIDRRGVATAELLAAGPVPTVAQTTFTSGVARLTGPDFGFSAVTGWPGTDPQKDTREISDVIAALELLRGRAPQNVSALAGVELIRVPVAELPGGLPGEGRAAEFFEGGYAALGAPADAKPYLKLANKAFDVDKTRFVGGAGDRASGAPAAPTVPASFQVILHEVGHAVEKQQVRGARDAYMKARGDTAAAATLAAGDPNYDSKLKAAQRKGPQAVKKFYDQQEADYKRHNVARDAAAQREQTAADQLKATRDPVTGNTNRLQKFITLVKNENIRKFTKYSADSWAQHPEEFYAEAYSLWLTDPTFLQNNYPTVFAFFENGDYLR